LNYFFLGNGYHSICLCPTTPALQGMELHFHLTYLEITFNARYGFFGPEMVNLSELQTGR
jgi:hypothetical protein